METIRDFKTLKKKLNLVNQLTSLFNNFAAIIATKIIAAIKIVANGEINLCCMVIFLLPQNSKDNMKKILSPNYFTMKHQIKKFSSKSFLELNQ